LRRFLAELAQVGVDYDVPRLVGDDLVAMAEGFVAQVQQHLLPRLAPDVASHVARMANELLAATPALARVPTLVHGDLQAENILLAPDGALAGVIDWDGAAVSDVAIDLSALAFSLEEAVLDRLEVDPPTRQRARLLARCFWPCQEALDALEHGGARLAAALRGIEARVNRPRGS
jgi:aminoglycoside phosphotransferase (APT) family kinase protein